ncbi:MAG TPA: class I SAM-dependent methyltransferase [Flavisolibacter sp.]|jgi:ubiquinone/menaquinone biosynthesis C-methylase UbiE|nr:class I SAM-dependent methyltransferase [Flavisolibacter sp.]
MEFHTAFSGDVPQLYEAYLGPVLFEPYAEDLAARIDPAGSQHVLELACGTGRLTRHLLRVLPLHASITATDLNEGMLNLAARQTPDPRLQWNVVDALEIPFLDGSFDTVICQFGCMFFTDKPRAFSEIFRVMKKGGRFLFNTWEAPDKNPAAMIMQDVMQELFGERAPDFFLKGPFSFYDQEVIQQLLAAAGFHSLSIESLSKEMPYTSASDFTTGFVDGSPLTAFLKKWPAAEREAATAELKTRLEARFIEMGSLVHMEALVISAYK